MKRLLAVPVIAIVLMAASPGTVKIDGDHSLPDNDPHVCAPRVSDWMSDSAEYVIRAWPPTGDKTVVLTGVTGSPETIALPNGHYKLESGHRQKVFWIDCPTVEPTAAPTPKPTPTPVVVTIVAPTQSPTLDADAIELPATDTVSTLDFGRVILMVAGLLILLLLAIWALGEKRR